MMETVAGDWLIGFGVATAVHSLAFLIGGAALVTSAEYGVEAGGGIEVHLVAALPGGGGADPSGVQLTAIEPAPQPPVAPPEPPVVAASPSAPPQPVAAVPAPTAPTGSARGATGAVGDGSSPIPGNDPTTLHATGGAWTGAKPSHLRNPAPRYPLAARQLGQEGLVIVRADVNAQGRPTQVSLLQSSGHALLDNSALEAIRRWRFHPARAGGMATSSVVEIPVRFKLSEAGQSAG